MNIVWRVRAERALQRQLAYIGRDNPYAADRLANRVEERIIQLLHAPFTGRPSRVSGVRELVIAATPYLVVYRVEVDTIVILNLFHTSQKR